MPTRDMTTGVAAPPTRGAGSGTAARRGVERNQNLGSQRGETVRFFQNQYQRIIQHGPGYGNPPLFSGGSE